MRPSPFLGHCRPFVAGFGSWPSPAGAWHVTRACRHHASCLQLSSARSLANAAYGWRHESATGHQRVRCTRLMKVTGIRPAADADAAQWLLRSDVDWWDLVRYGPPGFEMYVRITLPQYSGADVGNSPGEAPVDAVRLALVTLGSYTATPSQGYAAIW